MLIDVNVVTDMKRSCKTDEVTFDLCLLSTGVTDLNLPAFKNCKHALRRVEGVSPVVIDDVLPVVLLYA